MGPPSGGQAHVGQVGLILARPTLIQHGISLIVVVRVWGGGGGGPPPSVIYFFIFFNIIIRPS